MWCEFRLQLHCYVCLVFAFRDFDPVKPAGVSRFSLKSELLWPPTYCILHCCKTCNPWMIPFSRLSSNLACLYRWLQLPLGTDPGKHFPRWPCASRHLEISSSSRGFQMSSLFTWWSSDGQWANPAMPSCHLSVLTALTSPSEVLLFWPNCKLSNLFYFLFLVFTINLVSKESYST